MGHPHCAGCSDNGGSGNGNLIKGKNQKSPEIDNGGTAIETLKNRYTEGRIDKSEFEEKKTELEKKVLRGMK